MSKHGPEYERQRNEKYFTPAWVTEELLRREGFYAASVVDPGAGAGHIVDVVANMIGPERVAGWDIEPDRDDILKMNFLDVAAPHCDIDIIANPPFGIGGRLAVKFIEHAISLTEWKGGKVAMLLPLTFDAGKTRRHLFGDCPVFAGKYVLTTRIRWANLEQKDAGPMENHQWCIWDHRRERKADPFTRYI